MQEHKGPGTQASENDGRSGRHFGAHRKSAIKSKKSQQQTLNSNSMVQNPKQRGKSGTITRRLGDPANVAKKTVVQKRSEPAGNVLSYRDNRSALLGGQSSREEIHSGALQSATHFEKLDI